MMSLPKSIGALVMFACTLQLAPGQQKSKPIVPAANKLLPQATMLTAVTASPSTITFTATDPDLGGVGGSSAATVGWSLSGGSSSSTWNLSVQASSATFASCSTVPTSAVTVACTGVSGGTGGTCAAAVPLSTNPQQVASGYEHNGSASKPYSVTLNFTLTDSWSYIANSCTLTLTYTVNAP